MNRQLETPVALIIFNRPKCTAKTIQRIREVRPRKLFIIADGPRKHKPEDEALCKNTRQLVENAIDWPCELIKDYASQNMGCGKRLPSGLSNMFSQTDRAIILEDDILPHPSFFPFCSAMLKKYESSPEIMQISAYNRFQYAPSPQQNYFYSRFSDIWGWATWKRAWEKFETLNATSWASLRTSGTFQSCCYSEREIEMRRFCLDQIFSGNLDAWGMRWDTVKILNQALGIVPSANLAVNVGFGMQASHTVNPLNLQRFIKARSIKEPYTGPDELLSEPLYDFKYNKKMFPKQIHSEKIRSGLLKILGKK